MKSQAVIAGADKAGANGVAEVDAVAGADAVTGAAVEEDAATGADGAHEVALDDAEDSEGLDAESSGAPS